MLPINLSSYNIQEVLMLKHMCEEYINDYEDGYEYICNVRSYGRVWTEEVKNIYLLEELCSQYDGYDGIVDVYSTNPNLEEFYNYGDVYYIKSKKDYEKWKGYESLVSQINEIESLWTKWDNKEKLPYNERPLFEPYGTKGEVEIMKGWLKEYDMSFEVPKKISFSSS